MAISRSQLAKELEPGLNALFGMEYNRYDDEHAEIFDTETSDRAFEEEVMLSGFGNAPTKTEGAGVSFDDANEAYTARLKTICMIVLALVTQKPLPVLWRIQSKLKPLRFLTTLSIRHLQVVMV